MAKFNKIKTGHEKLASKPSATTNYEGGLSFNTSNELKLYLKVCTNMVQRNKFYLSGKDDFDVLRSLIHKCDRVYVLKLAEYTRKEMYLRSVSVMLLCEASIMYRNLPSDQKSEVREYTPRIIRRADELTEVVAYWINFIGKGSKTNFPNALKKGLADAFENFDEYQLSKYNKKGEVKLKDVVKLIHPKPKTKEQSELYKKILDDTLTTANTWEVNISTKGSTAENWNTASKNMGIMALLKNLRNFEDNGAEEAIEKAKSLFRNERAVRNSKQLPFRWLSARDNVTRHDIKDALHGAVELSTYNAPKFTGKTVILADASASMTWDYVTPTMSNLRAAGILAAIAHKRSDDALVYLFGKRIVEIHMNQHDSILTNADKVQCIAGNSTNAWKAIRKMNDDKYIADRIIVISDMQCYNTSFFFESSSLASEWEQYKKIAPNTYLYSIDVNGYGTSQFLEEDPKVILMAGWSDKVLNFIDMYERGGSIVHYIQSNY